MAKQQLFFEILIVVKINYKTKEKINEMRRTDTG